MSDLKHYLHRLDEELRQQEGEGLENYSEREKLLYLYAYYHYFNADISQFSEMVRGNVYRHASADRITGIYRDAEADAEDVDVLVVLPQSQCGLDIQSVQQFLCDAEATIMQALEKQPAVRAELRQFFGDEEYQISENQPMKICLVTDHTPNATNRRALQRAIGNLKSRKKYISFQVVFGSDIEDVILELEDPQDYVDSASLTIDTSNNVLYFGAEKSLIVNVSALSLKGIYEQYATRGLFSQNLRYYVRHARVDSGIIASMLEQPENFWYLNNGIIIICDDYSLHSDRLQLKRFSIINGGQTTKLVGETEFTRDFHIPCKVVRNKYDVLEERLEFIAKVAEASNTQKPIKDKDLIANRKEQRLLKSQLAEEGIYCQIKRGEKIDKRLYPQPWQNTTNEELGQFLLAFMYQQPGAARSQKASICSNAERYQLIYGKTYHSAFLGDLLKLKVFYKKWMAYVRKESEGQDAYRLGLVNNGMFFTVAIIGVMAKLMYRPALGNAILMADTHEQYMELLSQYDLAHPFLQQDLVDPAPFFNLFEQCYRRILRPAYYQMKDIDNKIIGFSNFTKVDKNYNYYVLNQFLNKLNVGVETVIQPLEALAYVATPDDLTQNTNLLKKYVHVIAETPAGDNKPHPAAGKIRRKLEEYRLKKSKTLHKRVSELFNAAAIKRIANVAPASFDELQELQCLDEDKLNSYGDEIVEVVRQIIEE